MGGACRGAKNPAEHDPPFLRKKDLLENQDHGDGAPLTACCENETKRIEAD